MAVQRALRRVFAIGVALCVAATAAGTPVPPASSLPQAGTSQPGDLFDEIYRRGAPLERSLQTVSASFIETSTSTLLKTPQVARGTLVARRPNQVRLDYRGADARTVVIDGNTLALDWPARSMRGSRDIGGTMRRASRFFDKGSPTELRKHFDIAAMVSSDRKGTWQVTFTPKRARMREGVSKVSLWIEQSSLMLQAMKMEYPGGDTRLMEFADVRVNPIVEADAFAPPSAR
jgi:outer membrane lipoprotein-sorting protein